jgi:two-component system LytT family response regulator
MTTALILDDEPKAVLLLKSALEKLLPPVRVIGAVTCVEEARAILDQECPDVLFLDVEMPGENGFQVLEKIQNKGIHIIIVTAFSEFAVKAFRFSVTDFLLKPVGLEDLQQAINKTKSKLVKDQPFHASFTLRIPSNKGVLFIPAHEVIRLEADGAYTHIFLRNQEHHLCSSNLSTFEQNLPPSMFLRVNRSHIINLNYVERLLDKKEAFIEMSDHRQILIPRRQKKEMLATLTGFANPKPNQTTDKAP